jgi:FkbM family methyltransferase
MTLTFKQKIQNLFFPLGSLQKIRTGYLKGFKIRLTENSLWSPLLGRWEPAMQKIMVNMVKPGQVVYDLGANNGMHGLLMAGLVGDKGVVYNFEPLEENIKEINENFALNGITNFRNVQAAVSDKNGNEHFVVTEHHKQGFISTGGNAAQTTVEVKIITLDGFIKSGNPGPSFIKIDIEGAEGPALNGFAETIGQYLPVMIIELHSPEQDRIVGKFLHDNRYTAFRFDTFANLNFAEIRDFAKSHPAPEGIWGSILCLPPGKKLGDYTFEK